MAWWRKSGKAGHDAEPGPSCMANAEPDWAPLAWPREEGPGNSAVRAPVPAQTQAGGAAQTQAGGAAQTQASGAAQIQAGCVPQAWGEAFPMSAKPAAGWRPGFAEAMDRASSFVGSRSQTLAGPALASLGAEALFPSEGPLGHRSRMRDRLLDRGADGLADYEMLEMLLFFVQPKGDTKPLAKRLINHFGSYGATICAGQAELEAVQGIGRQSVAALKLVHASSIRLARAEVMNKPVLGNWDQLMGYLNAMLVHERVEQFRILFLDTKNRLLADEQHGRGTVNHTPVYPREVARRALELHSGAVILVHNHPSGDPSPSEEDVEMTMQIESALKVLSIGLHDHIIIGNGTWLSLRKEGLL